MTDVEKIQRCLDALSPVQLDYEEWLIVGCIIKQNGGTAEMWDAWSLRDPARYKEGVCQRKFKGFNGSPKPAGIGSLVYMCQQQGVHVDIGDEYGASAAGPGRSWDWNDAVPAESDMRIVKSEWLQDIELPQTDVDGKQQLADYINTLFNAEEYVGYVADAYNDNGRWLPKKGTFHMTAGELLKLCAKPAYSLSDVIGDWEEECGAWIRFNPLDGKGISDGNVTSFRYALVESDDMPIEKQYALYKELELPIAALVHSAGKSLHAIVKIEAADFKEYQKRVDFLYDICKKNGLVVDRKNRNPSRLSRLPGATRNNKPQTLVATNIGQLSWTAWTEWVAEQNDSLPGFEPLAKYINNLPPLADSLIDGILRRGHKMLLSGPSKAGKSFLLLGLSAAIANGSKWIGWQCAEGRVLYINLEVDPASSYHRTSNVFEQLGITKDAADNIDMWQLRGNATSMDKLSSPLIRRALKERQMGRGYSAIIIDPIYKVITGDENAADQMAKFCNNFDRIAKELNVSVIYCHHHSKGDQGQKRAQDRASGSGVFARDPDALIDMIELEIDEYRREQIVNRWGCIAIEKMLDASAPGWRRDIGQDDMLVLKKFTQFASTKVPQKLLIEVADEAERAAMQTSGWRISGILREFAPFKPRNVFFRHPVHPVDQWDLLADARAEGELPPKQNRQQAIEDLREVKNTETVMVVQELYTKQDLVEISDVAEALNVTDKTARERLKAAGISYRKGDVVKPE